MARTKEGNRILTLNFSDTSEKPVETESKKSAEPKKKRERPGGIEATRKAAAKQSKTLSEKLSPQERKFCREYVKTSRAGQSVMKAGYNVSNLNSAGTYASHLLQKDKIKKEISRLQESEEREAIASAQEVMQMLTDVARGKIKDQFGLETSVDTRLKAMTELAKRTIDLENKLKEAQAGGDNTITIKLDWQKPE